MVIYLSLLSICTMLGMLMDRCKNRFSKNYKHMFWLAFSALFIVSAIRYNVGKDYINTYVFTYRQVLAEVSHIRADVGIMIIYKIMAFLNANVQWIFVITSFLVNYFVCRSIGALSKSVFLSYWIYICGTFYFFSLNGIRQSIAMALFYYSLRYIREKKLKKFLLLNVVGCAFHTSAIVFFPLYFLLGRRTKTKSKILIVLTVGVCSQTIVPFVTNMLLRTKYAMYLTNSAYGVMESLNFSMILNIILFLLYELKLRKCVTEESIIYSNIHFVGIIVTLFATSIPLAIRMFISFRFIEYLSVPQLVEIATPKGYRKFVIFGIVLLYFFYFIHGVYIENGNAVLPYQTILFM